MWSYNYNYLCHDGIKGMRWGVRRFQYEDGTLTPEGKKRYGSVQKLNYINAKKEYNRAFNKAYFKSGIHLTKKGKDEDTKRWEKVYEANKKLDSAKKEYKQFKNTQKEEKRIQKEKNKKIRKQKEKIFDAFSSSSHTNSKKYAAKTAKDVVGAVATAAVGSYEIKKASDRGQQALANQYYQTTKQSVNNLLKKAKTNASIAAWYETDYRVKKSYWTS